MTVKIIQGDARSTGLAARSVHMIATSPPYWGLRAYLKKDDPAKASEIGAESTPDAYVESMREVGRECYRVLRDDGVMWINLGDTYSDGGGAQSFRNQPNANRDGTADTKAQREPIHREGGLPSGNLVGIPWRVAFALQADGWILRAAIPWVKANCMPESVTNRPTVAHEYVFLFAKRAGYFYDADAVRAGISASTVERFGEDAKRIRPNGCPTQQSTIGFRGESTCGVNPAGRNIRTSDFMQTALDEYEAHIKRVRAEGGLLLSPDGDPLTFIVNPTPNSLGHFAMWPPKLVAPMILAGTSARGCCPTCGAQWRRKVEKTRTGTSIKNAVEHQNDPMLPSALRLDATRRLGREIKDERLTLGFFPSCSCPEHEPIPSTVFDPFGGTGTTAQVAEALGRDSVLCELNEAYHPLIRQRLAERLNPADWKAVPKAPAEQGSLW